MRNKFSQYGNPFNTGTVTHGTLRTQDLLRAFAKEYESLAPFNERTLVRGAYEAADLLDREGDAVSDSDHDLCAEIISDLSEALDRIAQAHGCYFGTTEGDGSDFGFWENEPEILEPETEWSGTPDPTDPDNYWLDDETGERVCAATGERTKR